MTKATVGPDWQRALVLLTGTVVCVVAVSVLYWAQSIFIPVALAVFLTFLLNPVVSFLSRHGLGRTPAAILTVFAAGVGLGLGGWLVTTQISNLLKELPKHTQNVKNKVRSLKKVAESSSRLTGMIVDINQELGGGPAPAREQNNTDPGHGAAEGRPTAVIVEPQSPAWLSRITMFLSPLMGHLGELALAIILVVFMLQRREELRNRVIRLAGHGRIVAATRFVDEAGQRISRFLLMQAIVNGTFGIILGLGLLWIGVKYALLWGFLGAMLRYLPYIGPYIAAFFPISLSVAINDGWGTTFWVIGLIVSLELIVANAVEPWLYGQSMGVSAIALLVSAAFWAFLWGPIGLVLSSPLTVCLVMLGRYVPQLEFLAVLLGDEPALEPRVCFYQRLLARDQDEAEDLIIEHLKTERPDQVYDQMLVPALCAVREGRVRGEIAPADEQYVIQSIREIVEDVGEKSAAAGAPGEEPNGSMPLCESAPQPAILVFGCPARDLADQAALEMLESLLDPVRWRMELIAPETLTAELVEMVAQKEPALVCIATIPPGGQAHTRYLCKRLRARFPDLRIIVGRWGQEPATADAASFREAGALGAATTLLETRQQLMSLLPVLAPRRDLSERDAADGHAPNGAPRLAGSGPAAQPWCAVADPAPSPYDDPGGNRPDGTSEALLTQ